MQHFPNLAGKRILFKISTLGGGRGDRAEHSQGAYVLLTTLQETPGWTRTSSSCISDLDMT